MGEMKIVVFGRGGWIANLQTAGYNIQTMKNQAAPANPQTHRPGWYQRLFASMLARGSRHPNALIDERKHQLLGPLRGRILEIGPGAGANLAFFSTDVSWIGIEPNPAMYPYLQAEAKRVGLAIEIRDSKSEALPVPDSSVDAVVSTLVLCSVRDPVHTLQEIMRVLKPGGTFVFIEHVAAPPHTNLRRVQNYINPAWQVVGDGCHPNRETWTVIEQAGFQSLQLEHFRVDVPIVGTQIAGVGTKK